MGLLHLRRLKTKPTEKKHSITILHIAASITFIALTVAMFMYYSRKVISPGLPIRIGSKTGKTFEESPKSLKPKKVIKPEDENDAETTKSN